MSTATQLSLKNIYSGKVRDLYEIDDKRMLMVASDRLSAFDVILDQPIPGKGQVLTAVSNFWFGQLKGMVPDHFTGDLVEDVVPADELPLVEGRAVVVKRLRPVPVEAIVRGYLAGSGWKEYQDSGMVCGIPLPKGLKEASRLPEPILPHPPKPKWVTMTKIFHMRAVKKSSAASWLPECGMCPFACTGRQQSMRWVKASS